MSDIATHCRALITSRKRRADAKLAPLNEEIDTHKKRIVELECDVYDLQRENKHEFETDEEAIDLLTLLLDQLDSGDAITHRVIVCAEIDELEGKAVWEALSKMGVVARPCKIRCDYMFGPGDDDTDPTWIESSLVDPFESDHTPDPYDQDNIDGETGYGGGMRSFLSGVQYTLLQEKETFLQVWNDEDLTTGDMCQEVEPEADGYYKGSIWNEYVMLEWGENALPVPERRRQLLAHLSELHTALVKTIPEAVVKIAV